MGNYTGKHTVYVHEGATQDGRLYKSYSIGISEKQDDGKWLTAYMPVNFKKGVELENKTQIDIKNGWIKPYPTKDGKAGIKMFVLDFETQQSFEQGFKPTPVKDDGFMPVVEDILPF